MEVRITQFNVQLYFKEPVLDSEVLQGAFANTNGFTSSPVAQDYGAHPMQNTLSFFRQGFRIVPVQSNVLPFRILQVMSYPNALATPDAETLDCLQFVAGQLQKHLKIDIENDIYAVRTVSHSLISGTPEFHRVLSKLSSIENMPSLAGRYVAHKNPMDAIQLVTRTENDLVHKSWSDIRVSQYSTSSYVVTIFNETGSLALALESVRGVKEFVAMLMREMEQASQA